MTAEKDLIALKTFFDSHDVNGRALIIGSKQYPNSTSRRSWYEDAVGLDMMEGDEVDIIHDMENRLSKKHGLFDHIDCCSVLEHVARPWKFGSQVKKIMTRKATILISVPFVWRVHGYPSDYWRMTPAALPIIFPFITWDAISYAAHGKLYKKAPSANIEKRRHLERCEVYAFGRMR